MQKHISVKGDRVAGVSLHSVIPMAAWLSGNALVLINVVGLRWARLVLG